MRKIHNALAIRSFMYSMACTRSYIAYIANAVVVVSKSLSTPGKEHWAVNSEAFPK